MSRDLGLGEAVAISEPGQVIGSKCRLAAGADGPWCRSFLWEDGTRTDLGTLGGTSSDAVTVNERGQVAGTSTTKAGKLHVFLWTDGRIQDLGNLGGPYISVVAMNRRGQVTGTGATGKVDRYGISIVHPFLWDGKRLRDIGKPGWVHSEVAAVNELGQVVGTFLTTRGVGHGFLWENGRVTDLGALRPISISDRGEIIALRSTAAETRVTRLRDGRTTDLGSLSRGSPHVAAVNRRGQIVGWREGTLQGIHGAFLWERGQARNLGTLDGYPLSEAAAINDRGQVVGASGDALMGHIEPAHPVVWSNGRIIDLRGLGRATDINNNGQIVGSQDGHAVLWALKP